MYAHSNEGMKQHNVCNFTREMTCTHREFSLSSKFRKRRKSETYVPSLLLTTTTVSQTNDNKQRDI